MQSKYKTNLPCFVVQYWPEIFSHFIMIHFPGSLSFFVAMQSFQLNGKQPRRITINLINKSNTWKNLDSGKKLFIASYLSGSLLLSALSSTIFNLAETSNAFDNQICSLIFA